MSMTQDKYTAESIKVLKGLEAVRKRPAMYIGSTGTEGLQHLVYEGGENSAAEVLHGVGVSVVNALSKRLDLEIKRDGGIFTQSYERGNPVTKLKQIGKTKKTGTKVTFWPDDDIFEDLEYNFDILAQRLRELSFLNKGLKIAITDERTDKSHEFQYKGGTREFVEYLNQSKQTINPKPIMFEGERENVFVDLALQ